MTTEMCIRCGQQVLAPCETLETEDQLELLREVSPEVSEEELRDPPSSDDMTLFSQGAGDELC